MLGKCKKKKKQERRINIGKIYVERYFMYIYCIEKLCTLTAEVEISCKKKYWRKAANNKNSRNAKQENISPTLIPNKKGITNDVNKNSGIVPIPTIAGAIGRL